MKSSKIVLHSTTAPTCQEAVALWLSVHPGWALAVEPWAESLNVTEVSVISPDGEMEALDCYPVNDRNAWIQDLPKGHWLVSLDFFEGDETGYTHSGKVIRKEEE